MQTPHLRFRDLRAISLGRCPSRWRTPSMRAASTWRGAPPLPNLPRPTSAVGSHPEPSRQRGDQAPAGRAGLSLAIRLREPCVCGSARPDARWVCWTQTAWGNHAFPLPHGGRGRRGCLMLARASEAHRAASCGLSVPIRPQHRGVRAGRDRTAGRLASGSASRLRLRSCRG